MAEASIPVDLLNPGQVFACLGFIEAADILLHGALGGFDWSDEANIRFRMRADGDENPFEAVLSFLQGAQVTSRSARELELDKSRWKLDTIRYSNDEPFPFPPPASAAKLAAVLAIDSKDHRFASHAIEITHWGESRGESGRDHCKFWAGMRGKPGAKVALETLELIRTVQVESMHDPFNFSAPQNSSFRFDWRRDYIALDIGFSPNNHESSITTLGYPIVELLASIGLTHSRPQYIDGSKLHYRYGVLGVGEDSELFAPFFLRASLGAPDLPFPQRTFRMNLGWPGKEGQARCITTVYEETENE